MCNELAKENYFRSKMQVLFNMDVMNICCTRRCFRRSSKSCRQEGYEVSNQNQYEKSLVYSNSVLYIFQIPHRRNTISALLLLFPIVTH